MLGEGRDTTQENLSPRCNNRSDHLTGWEYSSDNDGQYHRLKNCLGVSGPVFKLCSHFRTLKTDLSQRQGLTGSLYSSVQCDHIDEFALCSLFY